MSESSDINEPSWLERLLFGPNCRYREGRMGYYTMFDFRHLFELPPISRFQGHVELTGILQRIDNAAFNAAKMLEPQNQRALLESFCSQIVAPELENAFVVHALEISSELEDLFPDATSLEPSLQLWRKVGSTKEPSLERDYSCISAIRVVKNAAIHWKMNGCSVGLRNIKPRVTDEDIWRNYNMLTPNDHKRVENLREGVDAMEMAAIVALKLRMDTRNTLQATQRNDAGEKKDLAFKTAGFNQDQEISWSKRGQARQNAAWEVLGFREEGGFGNDQYSEEISPSRVRVLHSTQDEGRISDRLEPGITYYYSLFLKNSANAKKGDWFRFSARIPTREQQDEQIQEISVIREFVNRLRQQQSEVVEDASSEESLRSKIGRAGGVVDDFENALLAKAADLRKQGVDVDEIDRRMGILRSTFSGKLDDILESIRRAD